MQYDDLAIPLVIKYLSLFAVVVFCVLLRSVVPLLSPHGSGVDQWFWKAYINEYKKNKKIPPNLDQFILDDGQWYPPFFPVFMSVFSEKFLDRYSHIVAILIDLIRLFILMLTVYLFTGRFNSVIVAGLIYSLTPILISYNSQFNPRSIGAIQLDIFFIIYIILNVSDNNDLLHYSLIALLILISSFILLTHKMTAQLLLFFVLCVSIYKQNLTYIFVFLLSVLLAIVISKGFYLKVLIAHWDIVKFWNRNWMYLSAHPIKESLIYKSNLFLSTKFFKSGIKGYIKPIFYIFAFNPWVLVALLIFSLSLNNSIYIENRDVIIFSELIIVFSFILITTLIKSFRCLGHGYLYNYNASLLAPFLIGSLWGGLKHTNLINISLLFSLLIVVIFLALYFRKIIKSNTLKVDKDLNDIVDVLKKLPDGIVMCFPQHWHDLVAFKTNKRVYFGGHGYGFKKIENIFPILKENINSIIEFNNIKYLLTFDDYLNDTFIKDLIYIDKISLGEYSIYIFS